jgi:AAA domain-containing protein
MPSSDSRASAPTTSSAAAGAPASSSPYITPQEVGQPSLPGLVLTGADLAAERLLPRLRGLIPPRGAARGTLDVQQVDEIRSALHPEIRIGWGATGEEIVRVMDLEQERLARTLGDGHRLLRGVAGSGKTIVLICRVRYLLAQHPDWRILVVCYNRVLAGFLHRTIGDKRVEVSTFDAWGRQQLRAAGVDVPEPPGRGPKWDEFWVETVPKLLSQAFDEGRVKAAAYQAILIDEGQDFADTWYRVLLRALDPEANRLVIALDSSQNIYRRRISWRSLGIQIAGRTRVLKRNYRNTRSILAAAYAMVQELDAAEADPGELVSSLVVPDQALREGPAPELACLDSAGGISTPGTGSAPGSPAASRRPTSWSWATIGSGWRSSPAGRLAGGTEDSGVVPARATGRRDRRRLDHSQLEGPGCRARADPERPRAERPADEGRDPAAPLHRHDTRAG